MEILGIQKTTLVDYPGKIACTIFLFGCSFRCGFCYNAGLVLSQRKGRNNEIPKKEILDFLKKRKGKIEGVCITGGEPLMTLEKDFLKKIKSLGYKIKLDTNGSFPLRLREFIGEGLVDFVSMDVKGRKEDYLDICGVDVNIPNIEESMKIISSSEELEGYEFRTTIVGKFHDLDVLEEMGKWVSEIIGVKAKRWALQGFRNEGDFVDKIFEKEKRVFEKELVGMKNGLENYAREVLVR